VAVIVHYTQLSFTLQKDVKKSCVHTKNALVCEERAECTKLLFQPFYVGWKKKELVPLSSTLSPAQENDVIEYDEMWSFVQSKKNKQWSWLAVLRRNRQVVAFHFGKRDYLAFEELYDKVPLEFKKCKSTSDFWEAYDNLPKSLHIKCGKEEGETTQVESVNNVIRQRLARFVRKTCSFSKSLNNHVKVTGLFLQEYNLERLSVK